MKIYTKTGDAGETSLFDKTRVSKADPRVDAYGEVDELNATLGAARAAGLDADLAGALETIQKELFAVGARLADPSKRIAGRVTKAAVPNQTFSDSNSSSIGSKTNWSRCGNSSSPAARCRVRCSTWVERSAGAPSDVSLVWVPTLSSPSSSCISTACPICCS